jgi:hypothetical protein
MREALIAKLNKMLDEGDQPALEATLMSPVPISDLSPLSMHRCAARVECRSWLTGLDVVGIAIDGKPIIAEYDDAGVIQGFR